MNNNDKRLFNKTFDTIKELLESIPDTHSDKIDMGEFNVNYFSALKNLVLFHNVKDISLHRFSPESWVWKKIVKDRYPFNRLTKYLLP